MLLAPIAQPKKILALATLVGLALASSGCSRTRSHQGYVGDVTLVSAVQPGVDNKESVQASLGRPTFVGQFGTNEWYYFARDSKQLAFSNPKATNQLVLRVQFDAAGNVAAVTQSGIEKIAKISPNGDRTPTLGRNTSFFEELFGNVGAVGAPGAGTGGGGG